MTESRPPGDRAAPEAATAPEEPGRPGSSGNAGDARPRDRRVLLGCALALLAAILVMAARMEQTSPVDQSERIGRRMELSELIVQEQQRAQQLEQQVEQLAEQIAEHEAVAVSGSDELAELHRRVEEVAAPAGLQAIQGPGLTVTLEDSTHEWDGTGDPNNYVIHERDLRAVANALFAGGAEAISINDSRVLSTSSIICSGNTLLLNGRLHAPPFVVRAVGEPEDLQSALARDDAVARFARSAEEFGLVFDVAAAEDLLVREHSGLSGLELAVPSSREG